MPQEGVLVETLYRRIDPPETDCFFDELAMRGRALPRMPFVQKDDSMVYIGFGPIAVLSQITVNNSGRSMDLTNLNLGVALSLGGGIRFGTAAFRLEAKYLIEKESYKAFQASAQSSF